ncbi:MAG: hypothetical protein AB1397_02380 [bacterium]
MKEKRREKKNEEAFKSKFGSFGNGFFKRAKAADFPAPGSYTTIQSAINAANNGDTIKT